MASPEPGNSAGPTKTPTMIPHDSHDTTDRSESGTVWHESVDLHQYMYIAQLCTYILSHGTYVHYIMCMCVCSYL